MIDIGHEDLSHAFLYRPLYDVVSVGLELLSVEMSMCVYPVVHERVANKSSMALSSKSFAGNASGRNPLYFRNSVNASLRLNLSWTWCRAKPARSNCSARYICSV